MNPQPGEIWITNSGRYCQIVENHTDKGVDGVSFLWYDEDGIPHVSFAYTNRLKSKTPLAKTCLLTNE